MVRIGTRGIDGVIVDPIEERKGGSNPTYEVLPLLKEKYPADLHYFLVGGDSLKAFSTWIKPELVAKEAIFAVGGRGSRMELAAAAKQAADKYGLHSILLPYKGQHLSSSEVRASISVGFGTKYVDPDIFKVIESYGLYREYDEILAVLNAMVGEYTFVHSRRTVLYGMHLNRALGLPHKSVYLACLLHDCAKADGGEMPGVPEAVVHQFTGAEKAMDYFGIQDPDILSAIRYHTTGRAGMSPLEKLVFAADMLEAGRDFPGVHELRALIERDFEKGFAATVKASFAHLNEEHKNVYYLTRECYNEYCKD
jgi:predicted HD superfamily hydrolase involved in NAD metabolism